MFKRKLILGQLFFAALIALSFSALAEEIRDYYAEPGLNPFKETTQDLNELIDMFSGTLQQKYADLIVPGNGGLDITIYRTYTSLQDSSISNYRSYTGLGWTMHMGRIVVPTSHKDKICNQPAWSITTRDNPSLELSDGSRELLVLKDINVDETLITKTNWKADCRSVTQGMRVTSPNGTVYYMDVAEFSAGQHGWYTSRIEDLDGNWINISYGTAGVGIKYIDAITASDGRSVSFEYQDTANNTVRLSKVTANGQKVEYGYAPVVGGPFGAQHLILVTRPDGLKWRYTYYGDLGLLLGGSHSLKSVTYPDGGKIDYAYQLVRFDPTSFFETTSISRKDTSGLGISPGRWTYSFTPSTAVGVLDFTQVGTPNGTEVYAHQGYTTGGTLVWPTGLLSQKITYNASGNPVEAITNTWSSRVISIENYWHGRDKFDNSTAVPVLVSRDHWLDGNVVATVYGDYDIYGNPGQITEGCNLVGCNDRVITRSYLNDTGSWLIGLPLIDTIAGIGSTKRTYYGSGRLKSLDEYGVTTDYDYTPEGDLEKETNARGYSRTFSDYYRGVARQESSEVSATETIATSRVVNATGTVAMVTDGRGISRSFAYDDLNRLESIDFPVNDDVVISYGQGSQTLTRGDYEEHSVLNGFGRIMRQDRKDLLSGETISTATSYDALGRPVFQSYPGSALGITTDFDVVNRPTKIAKGDNTFRQIEYGVFLDQSGTAYLGEEKHTDERLNVSYLLSQYYGSFDNSVGLINQLTDETTTNIERSPLGEVTQVLQGQTVPGGIGNAITRTYVYDSRRFLASAANPETSTTVFGRDAVGNKISSQVGTSAATVFTYDGVNRLIDFDYPGATVDVELFYDGNSNLVESIKGDISWVFQYDDNDNLALEQLTIAGAENRTYELSYLYSGLDALSQITYPNAIVVDYAPDAFGRPTQAGPYAASASYHPSGVLNSVQYGNGIAVTNSLNTIQQLDGILAQSPSEDIVDLLYTYDPVGNVADIADRRQPNDSLTLNYDANNRLTSAMGSWGVGSISYSSHGDILSKEMGPTRLAYGYGASRRLLQLDNVSVPLVNNRTTYQYDAYGNVVGKSLRVSNAGGIVLLKDFTYLFDDASNLLAVNDIDTAEMDRIYQYDAKNYRVVEEEAGTKRFSVYNQAGVLTYESDTLTCEDSAYIYLGSTLVAKDVRTSAHDGDNDGQADCLGEDTTPPVVTAPVDLTVEATDLLTVVDLGIASATDDTDGALTPIADNAGPFALGAHLITWSATDVAGNIGTASQNLMVLDTTPPGLVVPPDVVVTSATPTAVVLGSATASDIFEPIVVTNDAPALFPLGGTNVTWQAVDANGNTATGFQTVTVNGLTPLSLNVSRDLPSPQVEGAVYTLVAMASGGSGSYEYRFAVRGPATSNVYQIIQGYSAVPSLVWNTTGYVGDNTIRVSVRNAGSTGAPVRRWVNADVNPASAADSLSVGRTPPSPQVSGAVYQFSAAASGGSGNYEYQYEVRGPATGGSFELVQGFSPQADLSWDTTGLIGANVFRISARNAGTADAPIRRWVQAHVNPAGAADSLAVTRSPQSPQVEGAIYQFSATASGGSGVYEYRFEVRTETSGGSYQVVQDYSPANVLNWDTTGQVGENTVRLSARNAGSDDAPVRKWRKADVTSP